MANETKIISSALHKGLLHISKRCTHEEKLEIKNALYTLMEEKEPFIQKTGIWIKQDNGEYICNNCDNHPINEVLTAYCPFCGSLNTDENGFRPLIPEDDCPFINKETNYMKDYEVAYSSDRFETEETTPAETFEEAKEIAKGLYTDWINHEKENWINNNPTYNEIQRYNAMVHNCNIIIRKWNINSYSYDDYWMPTKDFLIEVGFVSYGMSNGL